MQVAWPPTSEPEAAHLLNSFLHLLSTEQHRHPTAVPLLLLHSYWTHICISFVLAMVPSSLNTFLGTVIKYDLKPHYVSCKNLFPYTLSLFIYPLKKVNYEWMSAWIIHLLPSALNKYPAHLWFFSLSVLSAPLVAPSTTVCYCSLSLPRGFCSVSPN